MLFQAPVHWASVRPCIIFHDIVNDCRVFSNKCFASGMQSRVCASQTHIGSGSWRETKTKSHHGGSTQTELPRPTYWHAV